MANPILAIGVGGTGMKILVKAKERMIEAYGNVPRQMAFLGIDTQPYNNIQDPFCGIGLSIDEIDGRPSEYIKIVTDDSQNINDGFQKKEDGDPAFQWVNPTRITKTIFQDAQKAVKDGAGQIRPIGKMAIFLNYNSVVNQIDKALQYLWKQAEYLTKMREQAKQSEEYRALSQNDQDVADNELGKYLIFICGSNAGGTGSGVMMEIAHMVKTLSDKKHHNVAVQVIGLIVGPDVFANSEQLDTSNGMAFLQELNRLTRPVSGKVGKLLPRYHDFPEPVGSKALDASPFDNVFIFGAKNRLNQMLVPNLNQVLNLVVTPSAADFIVAHTDEIFAGKMAVVRANWPARFYTIKKKQAGLWPFAALGTKTLIFPERDVRRSAGLRFLDEVVGEYLLPPGKSKATVHPCSKELVKEDTGLDPLNFVSRRLSEMVITGQTSNSPSVSNVQFIEKAVNEALQPSNNPFGRRPSLKGSIKFVGVGHSNAKTILDDFIVQLEGSINASIEELKAHRNADRSEDITQSIRHMPGSWVKKYLGDGVLGSETGGQWDDWLFKFVQSYPQDFENVLFNTALAIMNDTQSDEKHILIKYRPRYVREVFTQFRIVINEFSKSVKARFSDSKLIKAMNEISRFEADARDGRNRSRYVDAWVNLAEAERDLLGQRLLLWLCDELAGQGLVTKSGAGRPSAVDRVDKMLEDWEKTLREVHQFVINETAKHNDNRRLKDSIPVREYLTDPEFEKVLYQEHREKAVQLLLGSLGGRQFKWQEQEDSAQRFFLRMIWVDEGKTLKGSKEIASNLIAWACSSDPGRPFAEMANASEVHMAERMKEKFGTSGILAKALTGDKSAALQTFTSSDISERGQCIVVLDTHEQMNASTEKREEIRSFYLDETKGVMHSLDQALIGFPALQRNITGSAENPRAATAVEVYLGFNLEEMANYSESMKTYWRDVANKALHTLKAEDEAAEIELQIEKHLGVRTAQRHILHPEVVDLIEYKERVNDFLLLYEYGYVKRADNKRSDGQPGLEYYLISDNEAVMLTDTAAQTDEELYGKDIPGRKDDDTKQRRERYRFYFALRNFVLYGYDLSQDVDHRQKKVIDYNYYRDLYQQDIRKDDVDLAELTQEREKQFREWIKDEDPIIRDLGILFCIRLKTIGQGLGEDTPLFGKAKQSNSENKATPQS